MDEGRKRVIGIMAAILSALHMQRADDLFGMPNGVRTRALCRRPSDDSVLRQHNNAGT